MRQDHEYWMKIALRQAEIAAQKDEVPVGAILVSAEGQILGRGHNIKETLQTPIGHAEIVCLHRAARQQKAWRLVDSTLYVTLEPCAMCAGALIQARVKTVIYGAHDPKGGALKSLYQLGQDTRLNHQIEVLGGVLEDDCSKVLKQFFKLKRGRKK